jgi:prepilin-type N-terminal cleavage/methylation domain-containing protein
MFKALKNSQKGFTLIEILVVVGIIAVLAAIVVIAINPARQFAQARNAQRASDVNAILNAIGQNIADNRGTFTCTGGTTGSILDANTRTIAYAADATAAGATLTHLRPCVVSTYITEVPFDPGNTTVFTSTTPHYTNPTSYYLGYTVARDATTGRVTVCSPGAVEPTISGSTAICISR